MRSLLVGGIYSTFESLINFCCPGLTCTEQNFITKAGAQRTAADQGVMIVAPDTSPRKSIPVI